MGKTALLVIELQNDYLWEKRFPKFNYDTDALIGSVNEAIARYRAAGCDVVCISQIFPDTPTNRLVFGFCITGTEGAALCPALDADTPYRFEKNTADIFGDAEIGAFFKAQGYTDYVLCGIDLCGTVLAAAEGAVRSGAGVKILRNCTATRFDTRKKGEVMAKLRAIGAEMI